MHSINTARAESQQAAYGRRRSNTAQSILRNAPSLSSPTSPLRVGDSKLLNLWVHDTVHSSSVIFNQACWPGVAEGDLLRVKAADASEDSGFLFMVPKDEGCSKPQLQVCIIYSLRDSTFNWGRFQYQSPLQSHAG